MQSLKIRYWGIEGPKLSAAREFLRIFMSEVPGALNSGKCLIRSLHISRDKFQRELKNTRVGGVCELAEAASVHYVSGGGCVWIGRSETRDVKVDIVEQVEELGAELKLHSLVDGEVFDRRQIDVEEATIRQHITGRVAECARGIENEKRGVEILIHL